MFVDEHISYSHYQAIVVKNEQGMLVIESYKMSLRFFT